MVVLHERHALVVDEHIVAEDADGDDRQGIAQWPVAPVVSWTNAALIAHVVLPCAVASTQEVDVAWIPHGEHPFLECLEVFAAPAIVVAHEFGSLRKLIAVESCRQSPVGVAAHQFAIPCPSHEDAHCSVGIRLCALNLPTQGILISHRGTTGSIQIVLSRTAATYNHLHGIGLYV